MSTPFEYVHDVEDENEHVLSSTRHGHEQARGTSPHILLSLATMRDKSALLRSTSGALTAERREGGPA